MCISIWSILDTHYSDVIMGVMASQITSLGSVHSIVYSCADQRNIKAQRHWPLWEFTGDRWILRTNGQWRGKCFRLMTSSCDVIDFSWWDNTRIDKLRNEEILWRLHRYPWDKMILSSRYKLRSFSAHLFACFFTQVDIHSDILLRQIFNYYYIN